MLLTKQENNHWAKYYSTDFINDDQFWQDCLKVYYDKNIGLPLLNNAYTVYKLTKIFKCVDNCGECCKCYKMVTLEAYDVAQFKAHGLDVEKLIVTTDGRVSVDADKNGRCPYLNQDNICSVYSFRPQGCFLFPMQFGTPGKQLNARLKCQPGLVLIRKIITDTINQKDGKILLPDLTIIQK